MMAANKQAGIVICISKDLLREEKGWSGTIILYSS